jgi:hypothetical protein
MKIISIYDFLKAVDENNRANEMALRYAASILADFKNLTPEGRRMMAEELMGLIAGGGEKIES